MIRPAGGREAKRNDPANHSVLVLLFLHLLATSIGQSDIQRWMPRGFMLLPSTLPGPPRPVAGPAEVGEK